MKKILLLFVTGAMLSLPSAAQNLLINGKDGSTTDLNLENLRKITFSKGNMKASYSDGTYSEYALSTIGKLAFETGTGLNSIEIMDGHLAYSLSCTLKQFLHLISIRFRSNSNNQNQLLVYHNCNS